MTEDVYVYVVLDEQDNIINIYNDYMDAIEYCVEELADEVTPVTIERYEYSTHVYNVRGELMITHEPLVIGDGNGYL